MQLRTKWPNTNLHPKESADMSTYLAAKECPYTYLDCVARRTEEWILWYKGCRPIFLVSHKTMLQILPDRIQTFTFK